MRLVNENKSGSLPLHSNETLSNAFPRRSPSKKSDIAPHLILRAKNPGENFQIWQSGYKQEFKYCRVTSIKQMYEGGKNVTYVFYIPFNRCVTGVKVLMCIGLQ